jgi:hypothetical protein
LETGASGPSSLPYAAGTIHAKVLLGVAVLAAIYGAVGFLFTRVILLLVVPALVGAIGYGLLYKRRFAAFLLCTVTLGGAILLMGGPFGDAASRWRAETDGARIFSIALSLYWLPFSQYYSRRWREFR